MAKSETTNAGCFSGVLRRMLCTGNVPTHPSENINDSVPNPSELLFKSFPVKKNKPEIQGQTSPGVVARLMGLDSLPADTNWVPKERSQRDSFCRSKSVNFADYMLNFDTADAHHRRVRTSVSFRESPVSFQQQSGDFVVVYLDDKKKTTPKVEMGFGESKQGKAKQRSKKKKELEENNVVHNKISKLKNEPRRKIITPPQENYRNECSGVKLKALKTENRKKAPEKFAKKRKNSHASKKIQQDEKNNNPENIIPDSFLDEVYDLLIQHETLFSGEKIRSENGRDYGEMKERNLVEECIELAEQLGKLTEEDLIESYWSCCSKNERKLNLEMFEEISMDFEEPILDLLLNEVISELVEISH
ncbi:hypothetical protein F8388_022207 [Cannabis sativa]|uniref:DUF3741 domain-containing protein n=1 Tax=Cannabis sativa TaxID=3483 RepID=A0A7J6GAC2_CANSA|nr:hypothetical protein F8388_022207 [Cannabis sativa]